MVHEEQRDEKQYGLRHIKKPVPPFEINPAQDVCISQNTVQYAVSG
jgi:hypothetical protein